MEKSAAVVRELRKCFTTGKLKTGLAGRLCSRKTQIILKLVLHDQRKQRKGALVEMSVWLCLFVVHFETGNNMAAGW